MENTFALVSLGCAKNLVNSEQMLYLMDEAGFHLVPEAEGADLVIINTCGFIDAAKSEAIDTILEMAELKREGSLGGIIVTGCLPERYKDSILKELPEIDAVLGVGSFADIVAAANTVIEGRSLSLFADNSAAIDEIPRVVSTGPGWVDFAAGCACFAGVEAFLGCLFFSSGRGSRGNRRNSHLAVAEGSSLQCSCRRTGQSSSKNSAANTISTIFMPLSFPVGYPVLCYSCWLS